MLDNNLFDSWHFQSYILIRSNLGLDICGSLDVSAGIPSGLNACIYARTVLCQLFDGSREKVWFISKF